MRSGILLLIGTMLTIAATATAARALTRVCPYAAGQLVINCPCDAPTRSAYLKCVARQVSGLRHLGCDPGPRAHCAAASTCGTTGKVVCCTPHRRPTILRDSTCTRLGGTALADASSTCDVSCP